MSKKKLNYHDWPTSGVVCDENDIELSVPIGSSVVYDEN